MKNSSYLITVLCFFVLFNNCNKTEESIIEPNVDPNFTDLNDTIIYSEWACYESYFYLDIDKDSIDDVKIKTFSSYSTTGGSEGYTEVSPLNSYEIAFSDCITNSWSWNPEIDTIYQIDTVMVPKGFYMGDSIFSDGDYTQVPIMITYGSSPTGPGSEWSSGLHYYIEADTNFYMAFRKIYGINNKLSWLKVKNYSAYSITLNSCLFNEDEPYLIIE